MAKLQVVLTEDGDGYYLSDGDTETDDAVDWGLPIDFGGSTYIASSEDGETVRLFKCSEVADSEFEAVAEDDDDDDDLEDAEGEEIDEDEEETEGVEIT